LRASVSGWFFLDISRRLVSWLELTQLVSGDAAEFFGFILRLSAARFIYGPR